MSATSMKSVRPLTASPDGIKRSSLTSQRGISRDSESEKRADKQRGTQAEVGRGGRSGLSGMKPIKEDEANGTIALCESDVTGGSNIEGMASAEAI